VEQRLGLINKRVIGNALSLPKYLKELSARANSPIREGIAVSLRRAYTAFPVVSNAHIEVFSGHEILVCGTVVFMQPIF
jgi:hypothetical protein